MASAGYDVNAGDTWALNELSSAVRRGDGTRRTDVRDFLRGLFDAAGEGPPTRGVVWIVGVGQRVSEIATYKARMQEWLQDSAFWVDMNAYVSDWSQEVYADVRGYAAPGAAPTTRRDALVDYLRHSDLLALAGGAASGTANAFYANAGSALANAAWQWGSAFGWTLVPVDLMQQFVSAEVYALRNHGARSGRPGDRFGFAWAPRNAETLLANDFTRQTGAVLDRLAAAIRDSAVTTSDPGVGACGVNGESWCAGDLEGATLTGNWRAFRAWSPTTLAFLSAPQAVGAGVVSAPITFQVQVAGVAARPTASVAATVTSSSPTGAFATSATGPFTPSLTIQLPPGAFTTAQVFYQDATAGTVNLTASAAGVVAGTQSLTVTGGAPVSLRVDPPTATLLPGAVVKLTAVGVDQFGNATPTTAAVGAHAGDTRQPRADLRAHHRVHRRRRSGRRSAHRHRFDPHGAALGVRRPDRRLASSRPRGCHPVRRREADAPRLRDGRRQPRPAGAGRLRDRRPLPQREGLRACRRAHHDRAHELLPARVLGGVSQQGDPSRGGGPHVGRRHARQRLHEAAAAVALAGRATRGPSPGTGPREPTPWPDPCREPRCRSGLRRCSRAARRG